jgi:hypothetical protein
MAPTNSSRKPKLYAVLMWLLPLVVIWHVLMFYGLPPLALFAIFLVAAVACHFSRRENAWLLAGTLVVLTLVLELGLKFTGLGTSMFYRPTEMLRVGNDEFGYAYRPNVHMTMHSPFSDLQATGNIGIVEPRDIEFVTDSLGFRNRNDYAGQAFFVVGDSIAMGEGATQACLFTEILKTKYGLDIYNLAHSGNQPPDYLNHAQSFIRMNGGRPKAIVVFFEGNDFERFQPVTYRKNPLRPYVYFFQDSNVYRFTRWLYVRAFKPEDIGKPLVKTLRNVPIAFEPGYAANVTREQPIADEDMRFSQFFDRLNGQIAHVFFVPEKYRVYAPLLDGASGKPLPNRNWEYLEKLARERGIPATNLYGALDHEAREALQRGEYVFWRGDTHWNCLGMSVAAQVMNEALHGGKGDLRRTPK